MPLTYVIEDWGDSSVGSNMICRLLEHYLPIVFLSKTTDASSKFATKAIIQYRNRLKCNNHRIIIITTTTTIRGKGVLQEVTEYSLMKHIKV